MNVIIHLFVYIPACVMAGVFGYMYQEFVVDAVRRVAHSLTTRKQ